MDNYVTLSNRVLSRAPQVGIVLAGQMVNDAWHTLQAMEEWSWRRRSGVFSPPNVYQAGLASTNVTAGNPTLITGTGTTWTQAMVGRQIRIGGLLYPYYTIVGWIDATNILIDSPWAGVDVTDQAYQILQVYYPVPADFGYFYDNCVVSLKDSYRLWTTVTESELAMLDPQRTNQGQTYAVVYRSFSQQLSGIIGPTVPVTSPTDPGPVSTTSTGYTYPTNATFIVQVVGGGISGAATYQWLRAGQTAFQPVALTSNAAVDLSDGVQIYWPDSQTYVAGDLFVINCQATLTQGVPLYELWPAPTFAGYLYPYMYMAKEYDITAAQPNLPPFVANRGEILLEMALEKCATYPGPDMEHQNPYFNLNLAKLHAAKVFDLMIDFKNNDQNVGVTNVEYQNYPMYPAPWMTGQYMATHAPFLNG